MKHILLLLAFMACTSSLAQAQTRPHKKYKRTYNHSAEASKGRNSKAQFRRDNARPVIDLNPRSLEKSKTTKAPRPYKYSKGV